MNDSGKLGNIMKMSVLSLLAKMKIASDQLTTLMKHICSFIMPDNL